MMNPAKIKKIFVILFSLELLFSYANFVYAADSTSAQASRPYKGVEQQIGEYLCAPTLTQPTNPGTIDNPTLNNDLFLCINKLYRFAIAAGGAVGVFFLVISGYLRMTSDGSQETIDKSKDIFATTITAMVILFGGYILLKALNPDLLRFESIQPPNFNITQVTVPGAGTGGGGGTTGGTGAGCVATEQNGCTQATISKCPAMAQNMDAALRACNQESMGGQIAIPSGTDQCTTNLGSVVSFSWGLWQINITDSTSPTFPECSGVLKPSGDLSLWKQTCLKGTCGRTCTFGSGGAQAFKTCTNALADPARNTQQACILFNQRQWRPWPHTRQVCNLP